MIPRVNCFLEWIGLKRELHQGTQSPPLVSDGDICWASVGENVGSEINGKSRLFSRPVIIYKKLAHGFYFVIPTTTKLKVGSWFVHFRQADRKTMASLHQARAIDHRRLSTKLGQLDDSDFNGCAEDFGSSINNIPRDCSRGRGKIPNVPSVYRLLPESQMKTRRAHPSFLLPFLTDSIFYTK
jgi:mRNA interferase MazF